MKRLFIGIPLENSIKDCLSEFFYANIDLSGVKWTPYANLHVTVFFIGNFNENTIPSASGKLREEIASLSSFTLSFERISLIKHRKIPRMFWAQYKMSDVFDNLVQKIGSVFSGSHKYLHGKNIPHITLARIKMKIPEEKITFINISKPPDVTVKKCVLWESVLHREGAKYIPVDEFLLKNYD